VVECVKMMIKEDMVNSEANLSNCLELKTRFVGDKTKLFEQLKIFNNTRISQISLVYPEEIVKISNKVYLQYICFYSWAYLKKDYRDKLFQQS
jgi:hypothetical protein